VLQSFAVCCSSLICVAVCCSVLQKLLCHGIGVLLAVHICPKDVGMGVGVGLVVGVFVRMAKELCQNMVHF